MVLSVVLAFFFGYALTVRPLLRAGIATGTVLRLAFASDTASIAIMEVVDNGLMLVIPGAMKAPLDSGLFWGSLALSLAAGCERRISGEPLADLARTGTRRDTSSTTGAGTH